jgi:hypothetical protein
LPAYAPKQERSSCYSLLLIRGDCEKKIIEDKILAWLGQEEVDFLPNEQKLTERGCRAVEKLAKQFVKEYQQQNANQKGSLVFYVL